ncbi:MAG: amidohydrolase family protein [Clostridia bacterium]|nr:amidohydrolase family protein [Clostridia bacterium]
MLIDFHSHIFPDRIAAGAMRSLSDSIVRYQNERYRHYTRGRYDSIISSMNRKGVDMSVILPIATKPTQTETINEFAKSIRSDRITSFGSLHPEQEDWESVLENLAEDGFKGIKLHPEYQSFFVDSKRSLEILKKAEDLGLYVTLHTGFDYGMPPPAHCQPDRLKNVLDYVSGKYIIAAHLGAFANWDEVEKYLVGTEINFDTAFISKFISPEQCKRIICNHGADKVLFGSDSPWHDPKTEYDFIVNLGFSQEENDKIFYKNALKILK